MHIKFSPGNLLKKFHLQHREEEWRINRDMGSGSRDGKWTEMAENRGQWRIWYQC